MPRPPELSDRAVALKPSLTLEISAKAKALRDSGKDICSLSAGEPDFATPAFIVEAAQHALGSGFTRYGPAAGDPDLRAALAHKLSVENGIPTQPEQVLVTNGGKQAIYNLFQVLLNPATKSGAGALLVELSRDGGLGRGEHQDHPHPKAEEGFRLDLDLLEQQITPRSRLLVINSPGNPSGQVMTRAELEALAALVARHPQLMVMSDEIYEYLLADGQQHCSFAAIAEEIRSRCFTVNGFAKGWAMTGWRLGYLAGDAAVIKAASALQSQSTSNVCSFAQRGALAAIEAPRDCVREMAISYNRRRTLLTEGLQALEGITLTPPQGAFYAFPRLPDGVPDSMEFCRQALEQEGLAVVPGLAFGDDRCIRLSCAVADETINDGLMRLKRLLRSF